MNVIAKNLNTENDAWSKRFYDKLRPQKFAWISLLVVTRRSNQLMYLHYITIRYYDSSDTKFYTIIKI